MAGATATLTKQEVERIYREWAAAFMRGDMAAVASLYTENGVVMPPGSEVVRGRQAIEQFWQAAREQMGITSVAFNIQDVVASGDVAYEVGTATLQITAPGGETTAKYVVGWRRQADGAWRLAADIWNSSTAP